MHKTWLVALTPLILGVSGCDSVTDPEPAGTPVSVKYVPCTGAAESPDWFAFQDGTTTQWTRVLPSSAGAYEFAISRSRGGVATHTAGGGILVFYGTAAEIQGTFPTCNGAVRGVTGTVTGYAPLDNVHLVMGGDESFVFGSTPAPATFELTHVEPSSSDLVAVRYRDAAGTSIIFQSIPSNVAIRRQLTGTTTPVIDFNSTTEAGAPIQKSVTVTNVVSGEDIQTTSTLSLRSTQADIAQYQTSPATAPGSVTATYYALPSSRLLSGESQSVLTEATRTVGSTREVRLRSISFANAGDQTFALGPSLGGVVLEGGSRPRVTWNVQTEYSGVSSVVTGGVSGGLYGAQFDQGGGDTFRQVIVLATKGYLGSPGTLTLQVPDLSAASGFSASWLLTPGIQSNWAFAVSVPVASNITTETISSAGARKSGTFTP